MIISLVAHPIEYEDEYGQGDRAPVVSVTHLRRAVLARLDVLREVVVHPTSVAEVDQLALHGLELLADHVRLPGIRESVSLRCCLICKQGR